MRATETAGQIWRDPAIPGVRHIFPLASDRDRRDNEAAILARLASLLLAQWEDEEAHGDGALRGAVPGEHAPAGAGAD
ncbi:MAG: hypothetical protein OWV35_02650 [Firmicutes bacterium]|nr:hypothetical protein [Bacillota bacterium]